MTLLEGTTDIKCGQCNKFFPVSEYEGEDLSRYATHKKCGHTTECPVMLLPKEHILNQN